MPHRSTPFEQMYPSLATRKRLAAQKRELEAVRLRREAAEYDRLWAEYVAQRDAQQAAERNAELASA